MSDSTNYIKPSDDFVTGGVSLLPDYLKHDTLEAILTIFLNRLKVVEDSAITMAEFRLLANAEGTCLDEIGSQMNIPRNGQNDDDYRTILLIRQAAAGKSGTRPQIAETLDSLFSSTDWSIYKGNNYRIDVYASTPCFELSSVVDDLIEIFPVMTNMRVVETEYSGNMFGFEGDDESSGFGSSNDPSSTEAGMLGKLVYSTE